MPLLLAGRERSSRRAAAKPSEAATCEPEAGSGTMPSMDERDVTLVMEALFDIRSRVVDIHEEMMALTQAIVAKTLFDADVSDEASAVGDASRILMEDFGARLGSL